ncbi:hypothetical protein GCM10029976_042650 [Kribbella albertanoniae]|uniref:Lipoprotein n=1 Tax=Kribbella albertanoniae TaxID=1266829 RepID=A0A4R4QFM0_9ACTN|nr:hypothetical protein [Kribbella albertanoniae]TDC34049.1 hypothetical protein E1261_04910 [Kribbella albertanoniae]
MIKKPVVNVLFGAALLMLAATACDAGEGAVGSGQASTVSESSGSSGDSSDYVRGEQPLTIPPPKVGPVALDVVEHKFAAEKTGLVDIPGGTFDLIEANGKTIYRFEEDTSKPSKVNCENDCAVIWPPVLLAKDLSVSAASGLNQKLIGTVRRADGYMQVTYNGWPLYWFFEDKVEGDAKGEALGKNWSTILPNGKPVFPKRTVTQKVK